MPASAKIEAMNMALRKSWTQAEFFNWAETQDIGYEFDGFQPVAMTGGTLAHSVITQNIQAALRNRLKASPCRSFGPDAGIATVGDAIRYPDALVTCSKFDLKARIVPDPVAVFEILSVSTSRTDRIVKLREYAAVGSIRRYVILESTSIGLTVMEREGPTESWRVASLTADDTLTMPEIGIEITVSEIYEGLDFEAEAEG